METLVDPTIHFTPYIVTSDELSTFEATAEEWVTLQLAKRTAPVLPEIETAIIQSLVLASALDKSFSCTREEIISAVAEGENYDDVVTWILTLININAERG